MVKFASILIKIGLTKNKLPRLTHHCYADELSLSSFFAFKAHVRKLFYCQFAFREPYSLGVFVAIVVYVGFRVN